MLKIISVGFTLKSADVINVNFEDGQTLLDGDVIIIDPESLNTYWKDAQEDGGVRVIYSHQDSDKIRALFKVRQDEIITLMNQGKIIIIFLAPEQGVKAEILGENKYDVITNYTFLPKSLQYNLGKIVRGYGNGITLKNPNHLFANYYKAFPNELQYFAYLDRSKIDNDGFFLLNKSERPIGYSININNGLLVFLPYPPNKFNPEKLSGVLINCAKPYLTKEIKTPVPEWVRDFEISGETELVKEINILNLKIKEIEKQKSEVIIKLNELNEFKALMYEQGKLLEKSAIKAFRILGFIAENRQKDDMEHDIILTSPEGRAIVEVEGKDNDSVHIDKLDQLSRVVDEDFKLIGSYPEGILLGNHFRYLHPLKRKEAFTEKVIIATKRKQFVLLTTFELYKAVSKVLENPTNEHLKEEIRIKIFNGKGKEIKLIEDKTK